MKHLIRSLQRGTVISVPIEALQYMQKGICDGKDGALTNPLLWSAWNYRI